MNEYPLTKDELASRLANRLGEISSWSSELGSSRMAYPVTSPLEGLIYSVVPFIEINSNNAGSHFGEADTLRGTRRLEREAIGALAHLFQDPRAEGWITSGATEGNLTGLWLAREYLYSLGRRNLTVFITILGHESIHKACRILALHDLQLVPLENVGIMSPSKLAEALKQARDNGSDGVIVVATVGATETGTCDRVEQLVAVLRGQSDLDFYLHVDSAFAGLVLPFSDPNRPFDFRVPEVSSLCVDLHKMGGAPIGHGVFLCRSGFSRYISQISRYAHVQDVTVLGSRLGAAAAVVWYALFSQGRSGFETKINRCLAHKKRFITALEQAGHRLRLIHDEAVNIAAISFLDLPGGRLPPSVTNQLRLTPTPIHLGQTIGGSEQTDALFYRFYFMPHLTTEITEKIAGQIVEAIQNNS